MRSLMPGMARRSSVKCTARCISTETISPVQRLPNSTKTRVMPTSTSPPSPQAPTTPCVLSSAELEAADAVLIGAPKYNFTIPSTPKAWLDQVIIVGHNAGPEGPVAGTPVTVVASRSGSYAPGTPREDFEFVKNYLEKVLTGMLGAKVDFIVPELTLAHVKPEMAELIPLADASRTKALDEAAEKAKALAAHSAPTGHYAPPRAPPDAPAPPPAAPPKRFCRGPRLCCAIP